MEDIKDFNKEENKVGILPHFENPARVPLISLSQHPVFPGLFMPIIAITKYDIKAIDWAMQSNSIIALAILKDDLSKGESLNERSLDLKSDIFNIGVTAKIIKKINLPDGGYNIFVSVLNRVKILKKVSEKDNLLIVDIEYLKDIIPEDDDIEIKAMYNNISLKMKEIIESKKIPPEVRLSIANIDNPSKLADFVSSILSSNKKEHQEILETLDVKERLEKVLTLIYKELDLIEVQNKISQKIQEKMEKTQREFLLKEELKAIKQELGIGDDKANEYLNLKNKIDKLKLTGEALDNTQRELEKFAYLEASSPEYGVVRNYLEIVSELPWRETKFKYEKIDLKRAKKILDKSHYGMDELKERVLEYLSVLKLKKENKGTIICLVGPPGTGKTSIGKAIATALGTKFFRFSVGGMRDEAEIKGHRRTYVGAMPGKIIQGLKIVKTKSPVFLIDEIDKVSSSNFGDPFSTLLEVLDPEQNVNFRDHYLDIPFDISQVIFVLTANTLETIPSPLLNRMEVIKLSGYLDSEKIEIARKYLIPKILKENGISANSLKFQTSSLKAIASNYARDNGVRIYEQLLNKIARKVAYSLAKEEGDTSFVITNENLEDYLGLPSFRKEEILNTPYPGMVMGLAWTNYGGSTLVVEAVKVKSKAPGIKLTGSLGEVMKESASIAYTYVASISEEMKIPKEYFEDYAIHIHVPEGATPKDGPSAGITIASALLSLFKNMRVRDSLAMTGELSLTGQIMAIGGLREKIIAAKRNSIKHLIIPKSNEVDVEKIPSYIKEDLIFHFVSHMREVIKLIF